jgi:hypothetical protein
MMFLKGPAQIKLALILHFKIIPAISWQLREQAVGPENKGKDNSFVLCRTPTAGV